MTLDFTERQNNTRQTNEVIEAILQEYMELQGSIYPVKVLKRTEIGVDCEFMFLTTSNIPNLENVPILQPEWLNLPIKAGTLGIVLPSKLILEAFIEDGEAKIEKELAGNLAGYFFIPITTKKTKQYSDDTTLELILEEGKSIKIASNSITISLSDNDSVVIEEGEFIFKIGGQSLKMTELMDWLDKFQKAYNQLVTTQLANNATIQAALSSLGATVQLQPLQQFNDTIPFL